MRERFTCIDLGTSYCPCHLAESGDCILCSQLRGKCFCDCKDWNGVCVYSELCNNKNKAKEGRKTYDCKVIEIKKYAEDILSIKIQVTRQFAFDLSNPGSYVFVRKAEEGYFDTPISIVETNPEEEWIEFIVKIAGVKTKQLEELNLNDIVKVRGPYFNGVFGRKEIYKLKEEQVLIIGRNVGLAPVVPVIKRLTRENNKIYLLKDLAGINKDFLKEELDNYNPIIEENEIISNGKLTDWTKERINYYVNKGVSHIHIGGADIITYLVIEYLNDINRNDISLSCCNNFKMACGEGVCGACTIRYDGDKVRRYCKYQTDPRTVFKGRWLI